jgi:hypothetical protein
MNANDFGNPGHAIKSVFDYLTGDYEHPQDADYSTKKGGGNV